MPRDLAADHPPLIGDSRPDRDGLVRRRRLRAAGVLLLVHVVLMEALVACALPVMLVLGVSPAAVPAGIEVFALPYLNENLALMMVMSGIFGILRTIGAVVVLRNRAWGFELSVLNSAVTLVLMIFMLPAGVADGLLAGAALTLLLMARCGERPILQAP
ncbi:hypothetical protein ITJ57_14845 [Plantibacter sp. VKM Ac-2880]|uniref:hypothetical protein n=1 Tax=Plantibacter sp. VKM Ac-2880 TaxID=2783827 RepID=UPI00189067A5|nr:hypothetical protein [Plantibacter sp. VKM Ac-2880]MBF4570048.1 hypothetical protein [Plantibacter sp. VKM Ac-2880]